MNSVENYNNQMIFSYNKLIYVLYATCAYDEILAHNTDINVELVNSATDMQDEILSMQTEPLDLSIRSSIIKSSVTSTETMTLYYHLTQNSLIPDNFQRNNPQHTYATCGRSIYEPYTTDITQRSLMCSSDSVSSKPAIMKSENCKRKNTAKQEISMSKQKRQNHNNNVNEPHEVSFNGTCSQNIDLGNNHNQTTHTLRANQNDYDLSKGIYNAIKIHRGYISNHKLVAMKLVSLNIIYSSNNENFHLNFQTFYNLNANKFLPLTVRLSDINRKQPLIVPMKLECKNEILKKLLITFLNHKYSENTFILEGYFTLPQFSESIKYESFCGKDKMVYNDLSDLVKIICSKPVPKIFYNRIDNIFQTYKEIISHYNYFEKTRDTYIKTITDMLFCMDEINNLYVLRPELWNLQLLMPEFYFYITWKIKRIGNLKRINEYYQKHLLDEIEHIFKLLQRLYRFSNQSVLYAETIITIKSEVYLFRTFILNYLKDSHPKTISCTLYAFGYKYWDKTTNIVGSGSISIILYMLAFTEQSTEFRESLHHKLNIDKTATSIFICNRLMKKHLLKENIIATLQMMTVFLSYMKNGQKDICYNGPTIVAFQKCIFMIYQRGNDSKLYILSISKTQMMQYFYDAIYDAILN